MARHPTLGLDVVDGEQRELDRVLEGAHTNSPANPFAEKSVNDSGGSGGAIRADRRMLVSMTTRIKTATRDDLGSAIQPRARSSAHNFPDFGRFDGHFCGLRVLRYLGRHEVSIRQWGRAGQTAQAMKHSKHYLLEMLYSQIWGRKCLHLRLCSRLTLAHH